jgi:hypothetical protein
MRTKLNKTSETAGAETQAAYERTARRHIARAAKRHPHLTRFSALLADMRQQRSLLRPRTVRLYRVEVSLALQMAGSRDGLSAEQIDKAQGICRRKLERLKGRTKPPQTASKKVKDVRQAEVERIFAELKRTAIDNKNMLAAAAALCCVIAPRMGPRPKELLDAELRGDYLVFQNAKATVRHPDTRALNITAFGPAFAEAVVALLALVAKQIAKLGFEKWRNAMAETLARACARVSVRRLSLYSFRHVALASWEAAGFSKEEIASMAGHLGLETARIHYARGKDGWKVKAVAQPATELKDDRDAPGQDVARSKTEAPQTRTASKEKPKDTLAKPDAWAQFKAKREADLNALDAGRADSPLDRMPRQPSAPRMLEEQKALRSEREPDRHQPDDEPGSDFDR